MVEIYKIVDARRKNKDKGQRVDRPIIISDDQEIVVDIDGDDGDVIILSFTRILSLPHPRSACPANPFEVSVVEKVSVIFKTKSF